MKTTNATRLDRLLESFLKLESTQLTQQELTAMTKKELLTNGDFTLLFSITPRTAYNWRKRNLVEYVAISRRVYFHWASVMKLLKHKIENPGLFI